MFYGRVIGSVVCTAKDEKLMGFKLLVVQKTNYDGEDEGEAIVAVDAVQAGVGDFVFMTRGKESALPLSDKSIPVEEVLRDKGAPVDATIVGIIDKISVRR
ncbi:MAG TPA: EutN/CcmL family microcompartment protein [Clostridiales bacterium]|nr:EutN/CcmL family microcompartment protein [Clostridiales bacterium]